MCVGLCGLAHADSYRFNGTAVAGCSRTGSGSNVSYVCDTLNLSNYNDTVTILRGVPVTVNSSVTFGYNQAFSMDTQGSLTVNGDLDISNINPSLLSVTGGTLTANGGTFSIGAQAQTITADVSAAKMNIGTGSTTKITGNVTSTGTVAISSNVTIVGTLTGTAITTQSPVTITGDVSASTSFSLASGSTVSGNVVSPKIMLLDSEAYIGGNVSTADITLGWHGRVAKTITCTDGGGANCTCVTNNSGYVTGQSNGPVCKSSAASGPDHIQITHSGTALTCQPQTVTVTACANASCSSVYTGGGTTVTLQPGGQQFTIGSSGVNTAATVQDATARTDILSLTSSTASGTTTCVNTGVNNANNCSMTFSDAGLLLGMKNQVAASGTAFTLAAVAKDATTQACVPMLTKATKSITFACSLNNPSSGGSAASVLLGTAANSVGTSGTVCPSGGTTFDVYFGDTGQATLYMFYPDVGQLGIKATYSTTNGAPAISAASSSVIVAPDSFDVVATSPQKAGVPFSLTVRALNAAKNVTPNFGKEKVPESVILTRTLSDPSDGAQGTHSGSLGAFSAGVATASSDFAWNEVGTITYSANLANSAGYLNGGVTPTNSKAGIVFKPDHFDTAVESGMACDASVSPLACATFVYSSQPFSLSVTAKNASGAVTTNYEAAYAKATTLTAWGGLASNGTVANPPGGSSAGTLGNASVASTVFNNGTAVTSISYAFSTAYDRTSKSNAYTSPTDVRFRARDDDGVTSAGTSAVEAHQMVLTGRLYVANSYGSELLPLPVLTQVQYWNSSNNWVTNLLDSSTKYSDVDFTLTPYAAKPCSPAVTALAKVTVLINGTGTLRLKAPGAPNNCAVDVTFPKTNTLPYLPSTTGRARFGIYRSGPVTYIRETYY